LENELRALLMGFAGEIAQVRVLDPASGSGNFLYVALRSLLDLEKAVIAFAADISAGTFFPQVGPEQLRGIEINEYAHELAQITVWIGYIQWLPDNGFGTPSEPILKPLDTIKRMDAILAFEHGRAVEPEWPEADIIIGNPPFLGDKKMRAKLGDEYVETLRRLYEGRVPGGADLVTYWFERARALIEHGSVRRAGLLTTQGIRGGTNRKVLERIKASGNIFMSWSDRKWIQEGAAVQVSMVGFDNAQEQERILDGTPVQTINPDLTATMNLTTARSLTENYNISSLGMMKAGPFDIDADITVRLISMPIAISLGNLAALLQSQGDYKAARSLFERALAIHEQVLGPRHPLTATSLNNLAGLLRTQGDYAAARPLLEHALAIREQALGPQHPSTQRVCDNLAALDKLSGDTQP
jgi:tetratricopeptide (TPR) repeat protein